MSRFISRAEDALFDTIVAKINAKLAIVETENGLNSGDMTVPEDIIRAENPFDTRSPLVHVFWTDDQPVLQREQFTAVNLIVAIRYMGNPNTTEEDQRFVTRYLTALMDCIEDDTTLGGKATAAIRGRASRDAFFLEKGPTRHVAAMEVQVRVHTP